MGFWWKAKNASGSAETPERTIEPEDPHTDRDGLGDAKDDKKSQSEYSGRSDDRRDFERDLHERL